MKISTAILVFILTSLGGCSKIIISPHCNFTNFTRNEELNKIAMSVQVEEGRAESERFFLRDVPFFTWEENSKHFNPNASAKLIKPSVQLLQESLSSSFSAYSYNVSDGSSVVMQFRLLRFMFYDDLTGNCGPTISGCESALIETELTIQKDGQILTKKLFGKYLVGGPHSLFFNKRAEPLLSSCLTMLVRDIVLDREIETALKKAYGLLVQEEQVIVPRADGKPDIQDSPEQGKQDTIISTGTGFAICENGYIATAEHVVENAISIYVKFQGTEWLTATVVQKSKTNDIAILKVDRNTKSYLTISNKLRQGEKVFTLGYPVPGLLGEEPKYAEGTVSSLTGIVDEASLMQISVPLQPGNSGGPLLNEKAEVIGMATSAARIPVQWSHQEKSLKFARSLRILLKKLRL